MILNMFDYAKDVSLLAHDIIDKYIKNYNIAIDCTLGNGYDTDFLCEKFSKVYSFDIQESAIESYSGKKKDNTVLICDSHENILKYIEEKNADCIMYNLGFLPGGDKTITTLAESTLNSIQRALELLNVNGMVLICSYLGHEEGMREKKSLVPFLKKLDKSKYGVVAHEFINRSETAPMLFVIEKK